MGSPLILPWPNASLSPNARVHWAQRARLVSAAFTTARLLTKSHLLEHPYPKTLLDALATPDAPIHLHLDFYPPDRRRRDDDNLLSMFKAYRDGIADVIGIDDYRFISHPRLMPYCNAHTGTVHVTLAPNYITPVIS